jgi:hypothetical protein
MQFQEVYSSIPSVFKITLKTMGETILFGSIYILGCIFFPIDKLKTTDFYD